MFNSMIEITARTKKWGNSIGVILPKNLGFREDQDVHMAIESPGRKTKVKDIFGTIKLKKSTEELMKEIDSELDSK